MYSRPTPKIRKSASSTSTRSPTRTSSWVASAWANGARHDLFVDGHKPPDKVTDPSWSVSSSRSGRRWSVDRPRKIVPRGWHRRARVSVCYERRSETPSVEKSMILFLHRRWRRSTSPFLPQRYFQRATLKLFPGPLERASPPLDCSNKRAEFCIFDYTATLTERDFFGF